MSKREIDDRVDEGNGLNGKALALLLGKNKKERKAIETTYKYFQEFGKTLSRGVSSSTNIRRDISIITSVKRIIDYVLGAFLVFVIVLVNCLLLFILMPSADNDMISANLELWILLIIALIILDGIGAKIFLITIHLRDYYIILEPKGIYYKKVGKPKFIAWSDMTKIHATMRYMRTRYVTTTKPNDLVVKIYLKYNIVVRFRAIYYIHIGGVGPLSIESFSLLSNRSQLKYFADIFKLSRHRQCPFSYNDKWERLQ